LAKQYKQFYLFKFNSSRLHQDKYNIKLSVKQAQKNLEYIALGDNQLFRTIRQIQRREIDVFNKKTLFMPEVITIVIEKGSHYKYMVKNGVTINNTKYKRFLCGAGHARNNTVYFIDETIYPLVLEMLKNGHDSQMKMNPAKYNAYFGLYASASKVVTTPSVCVIPDFKYKKIFKVDWIEGDNVTIENKELEINAFDGQGIVSTELATVWASDLKIKYIPSEFIIRAPFIKGMVVNFDFHTFAKINNIQTIKDLWGKEYDIENIDLILSESQFKLWNAYSSWKIYEQNCNKNNLQWAVSRVSPKKDKDIAFTNYQYLQTLKLENEDIEGLCRPTIEWLESVATDKEPMKALLFLLGESCSSLEDIMELEDNDIGKTVVFNNKILRHPYVKNRIHNMINRKLKDSCMGKLAVKGNYSIMVSDPYAQTEWGLGLQIEGLLKEGQHYSHYWNEKNKNVVSAIRSPMTYYSENNLLNLQNNEKLNYWYKYLNTGIVFNVFGTDAMRMSGSDFDGDICMTTDQKEFIDCAYSSVLPPTYDRKNAEKKIILEEELWDYDVKTFKSKIGLI